VSVTPGRGADGVGADRAGADRAARLLSAADERGLLDVRTGAGSDLAGLVVSVGDPDGGEPAADVRLVADASLAEQVGRLWADRAGPFARRLARIDRVPAGPAVLAGHDRRRPGGRGRGDPPGLLAPRPSAPPRGRGRAWAGVANGGAD
jgi:hypothetical protein